MKWQNFISVYDVLVSILPSALSTFGTILIFDSPIVSLIVGILILILVLGALIQISLIKKEKALAEILATGYFINFVEPLANNIYQKTTIYYPESSHEHEVELTEIKITLKIPVSTEQLVLVDEDFRNNKSYTNIQIDNLQTGGRIWLKAIEEESKLILMDYPRTLLSLPKFIKTNVGKRKPNRMKKYYESFYNKLEELIDENSQNAVYRKIKLAKIN